MQIFGKIVKRTCFVLLAVLMGLSMLIALAAAFFSIADEAADASARVLPSYARGDISGVLLLFASTMTAVIAVAVGAAAIFLIRRICAEE